MRVLVLCGGESAERIVSHASGDAVATWIEAAGHTAIKYDPEKPGAFYHTNEPMAPPEIGLAAPLPRRHDGYDPTAVRGLLDAIDGVEPDVIFPILHGGRGEDGTLQALLEWTGVPYTGSGVLASSVAMNKLFSRTLFQSAGIPVA
ncbi:hypothetical protein KKH27_11100 [bacterium]|nr:hypothetical protein [bacterium]